MHLGSLTNDELLRHVDDRRHMSPVIDELCKRLEIENDASDVLESTNHKVTCVACDAPLRVDYDAGNQMFNIQFDKD